MHGSYIAGDIHLEGHVGMLLPCVIMLRECETYNYDLLFHGSSWSI